MSIYRGRSIDEVIPQIQRELGSDAIIVRRREGLAGGVLGFFQRPFVEIEALPGTPRVDVYDEPQSYVAGRAAPAAPAMSRPVPPAMPPLRAPSPQPPAATPPTSFLPAPSSAPVGNAPAGNAPASAGSAPPAPYPPFYERNPAVGSESGSAYVTAHLAALARAGPRAQIPEQPNPVMRAVDFQELLARDMQQQSPPPAAPAPPQDDLARTLERTKEQERRTVAPGSHARARAGVEKNLRRFGISEAFAGELIDSAAAHMLPFAPRAGLAHAVRLTLAQRIPVAPPLPSKGAALVVVGAGGAGKTTSCAALLGAYRNAGTLPAGCATLLYAPDLSMILSPQILKALPAKAPRALKALRKVKSEGLAVIDTPRLSPADRTGIRELASVLEELGPERVLVALPTTLGAAAASQLLKALEPLRADSLVLTHAEETDQIGVAVEAACRFNLAPEYMLDRGRGGGWRLTRIDPTGLAAKLLP